MAGSLICAPEADKSGDGLSVSAPKDALFKRRIEFHLARKPFNPYSSNAGNDFHLETLNPSSDSQRHASSSAVPSGSTGKKSDAGGEFFEHGLDPELGFEITFRRIGAGLANLGNTCFLNSVLQCLTYTEPFAAYLQSGKHKSSCHTAGFCALCAIQNHVRSALQSTGKILSPFHLVKNLRCISRNFRNSRQEDAHEYMVNLLESMHKCCLPSGVSSESPSAYEKSLVHKIFGGRLRSQVKCMQCSYCSNKFDPFLDLSLEIVKADSLRKALVHFTATEQLDGGERQYQCQRCKEKVKALKQLTVHKAPYVLTIHLKRFGSDIPGQKIDRRVEFGHSLDLKPFVSGSYEGDLKYTLYGVLVHAGWSTHSGHYYCFVRTSSGMWYSLDDNRVFQVSERTVLEQKAYMLFYVRDRRSTVAPKKPLDVVHRESMASNTTRNKEVPVSSMGSKEAIANGQKERSSDALKCASLSRALPVSSHCQSISSAVTSLKEPITTESSGCRNKDEVSAEVTQRSTQLEELVPSPNSTLLKKPSVLDVRSLPKPVPPAENGSVATSTIRDATYTTENARNTLRSEHHTFDCHSQGSGEDSSIMVAQKNDCNGPNNSKKLPYENGVHENGDTVNERMPCNLPCKVGSNTESVDVSEIKQSSQSSTGNGFIHKKSYDETSGKQNCGMLNEKDPLDFTHLVRIADDHLSAEPKLKPKKLGKAPVMTRMCLGPKRLFLAYLSLRKKKKHKRSKKHILDSKKFTQKDILGDYKSNDPGTSTSVKDRTVNCDVMRHKKKRRHDKLKKVNSHKASKTVNDGDDNSLDIKDRGPEERSGPDLAVLATHQLLEKSSNSEENRCDLQDKRALVQSGMMSMLTRGLEMPTVARWNDIESPLSETFGMADAQNRIGYVLDEWDEEYDRGKRKKVKKTRSFDGKNPFQEFSDKMAQKKMRMAMDRSSAGNQPFRI